MARRESDREDLMREATALKRRLEIRIPSLDDSLIAGFRSDGSLSLYFGPDPVYHFDPRGRLRRAFVDDRLFRTQGTTLARLTRVRTSQQTELQRHDLTPEELAQFLAEMNNELDRLRDAFSRSEAQLLQQVPPHEDLLQELKTALEKIRNVSQPLAPRIKGKR